MTSRFLPTPHDLPGRLDPVWCLPINNSTQLTNGWHCATFLGAEVESDLLPAIAVKYDAASPSISYRLF
jgi:hypothetical protein